jgi:hypothetical protein
MLIVIDQFEEVLSHVDAGRRAAFAAMLRQALAGPVHAVATIRAESLQDLLSSPELSDLTIRTLPLRPLRRDALQVIIEQPALLAGMELDNGLVARLVADTGTGDALPLLAFTLSELAQGVGRGGRLSTQRYSELGGVHGALQRQADSALANAVHASGRVRGAVLASLLRLVSVDDRGDATRRRVRRDELPAPVLAELNAFVRARLISTDLDADGEVLLAVTHEAFLTAWRPLAELIRARGAALRARQQVEHAAAEWDASGRPRRRLWEGNQLGGAVTAMGAHLTRRRGRAQESAGSRVRHWWRAVTASLPVRGAALVTAHVDLDFLGRSFLRESIRAHRRRRGINIAQGTLLVTFSFAVVLIVAGNLLEAGFSQSNVMPSRVQMLRYQDPNSRADQCGQFSGAIRFGRDVRATTPTWGTIQITASACWNGNTVAPDYRGGRTVRCPVSVPAILTVTQQWCGFSIDHPFIITAGLDFKVTPISALGACQSGYVRIFIDSHGGFVDVHGVDHPRTLGVMSQGC